MNEAPTDDIQIKPDEIDQIKEKMAEAMNWTTDSIKTIPEEAYNTPSGFAMEMWKLASKFFPEAHAKYGDLAKYKLPPPKEQAGVEGLRFNEYKIDEDCCYSFVNQAIASYISKKYPDIFFQKFADEIRGMEMRRFLQKEPLYEPKIPGMKFSVKRWDVLGDESELRELCKGKKEIIKKLSEDLSNIHMFHKDTDRIAKIQQATGLSKLNEYALDHIIGTDISYISSLMSGYVYYSEME